MRSCCSLLRFPTDTKLPLCHPPPPPPPPLLPLRYKFPNTTAAGRTTTAITFPTSPLRLRPSFASLQNPSSAPSTPQEPFSVLFVCLGNICRSPAAEGVLRSLVKKRGLDSLLVIDSAGTIGYHEGDKADPRMRAAAKTRGIEVTSISRKIRPSDFRDFDLILAMDLQNRDDILDAYERWSEKESLPENAHKKVKMMCSYCKQHTETQVPDPYYRGPQGFEKVLDLLEDACSSLLDAILAGKI